MKRLSVIVLMLMLAACASGQAGKKEDVVSREKRIIGSAMEKLREGNTAAAERRYKLALASYQKKDDRKNTVAMYITLANISLTRNTYDAAKRYAESAMVIAEREGYPDLLAEAIMTRAVIMLGEGATAEASIMLEGVSVPKDERLKAKLMNAKGRIYMAADDTLAARQVFNDALELARSAKDAPLESSILSNIGLADMADGKPAEALKRFTRCLELDKAAKDTLSIATSLHLIGMAHEKSGDMDSALYFYDRSLHVNIHTDIPQRAEADKEAISRVEKLLGKTE